MNKSLAQKGQSNESTTIDATANEVVGPNGLSDEDVSSIRAQPCLLHALYTSGSDET